MIQHLDSTVQKKIKEVYDHQQDHIFRFWELLNEQQRKNLLAQIELIDFSLLARLTGQALDQKDIQKNYELSSPEVITLDQRMQKDAAARTAGEELLSRGKIAAFLVAGGQGTRLGFDGPKGMFPVTPVKQKSLFQLHAEKLLATGNKYGAEIPWYIMTSLTNNEQTIDYFRENNYFGYHKENMIFFNQQMIPAIDRQGKMILDQVDHIFMNPNGHGGSIKALWESGALSNMKERGIEHLFYFQVDNVLTRICDPVYIGYHVLAGSEMSCKVVRKKYPEEKMGILCEADGKLGLVEYSDLSKEDMFARNADDSLKLWAGNIATHIFDCKFIERENKGGFRLPYHIAEKSIPFIDANGRLITPQEKNGIKFETFVFDALMDVKQSVSIEVERKQEFSPLKNKEGENSPETVRIALLNLYARWLEDAGHAIPRNNKGEPSINIEISPRVALTGGDLQKIKIKSGNISDQFYLE
jgi:UDP-N-acetylglucosamine/UDP-N-acetylgalactosamine diphosphorylase